MTRTYKAWHFLREDRRLGYGDGREVIEGKTLTVDCDLALCKSGLHASTNILDALKWAPGPVVCRVEIGGTVILGGDKIVGTSRKALWMFDATDVLHEFACRCAEDALALVDDPDPRSVAAIAAKRQWMRGEITDEELRAAWEGASHAAGDAAGDAAWDAAWDAGAAAWDAAVDAARDAARGAAWAAAWDVAGDAARARQSRRLVGMISAARRAQ